MGLQPRAPAAASLSGWQSFPKSKPTSCLCVFQVLASWEMVLGAGGSVDIRLAEVRVALLGAERAFVTCTELINAADNRGRIAATNVFEKQVGFSEPCFRLLDTETSEGFCHLNVPAAICGNCAMRNTSCAGCVVRLRRNYLGFWVYSRQS